MTIIEDLCGCVGDKYVLSTDEDKAAYEIDETGKYRSEVLAVVRPGSTVEVSEVVKLANSYKIAIVPMGGNTGLCGGCFAGTGRDSLILSVDRISEIFDVNEKARTVTVGAGAILQNVHDRVEALDMTLPISFGAKGSCHVGGVLSTNAGGSNVVRYGPTRSLCLGLEAVMPNGDIVDVMNPLRKNNTGYDIKDLLIGAEGTLGIITKAVFRLHPKPRSYVTAIVSMSDLDAALYMLNAMNDESDGAVEAFEYMPGRYFDLYYEVFPEKERILPEPADVNIMVELGLMSEVAADESPLMKVLEDGFEKGWVTDAVIAMSSTQRRQMWECREAALDVLWTKGQLILTDLSLPLDQVSVFLKRMSMQLAEIAPTAESMEITHLGDGNVHFTVWETPVDAEFSTETIKEITTAAERLTHKLGGAFSAEHGVGIYKLSAMQTYKDPAALTVMRQIKSALDPNGLMNPNKVVPPETADP